MKRSFLLICLALTVLASSCKRRMTKDEFSRYQVGLFLAYYTNNVWGGKDVLYRDLLNLSKWESNHVEGTDFRLDYDGLKAVDHERLFLIYWRARATNEMEFEYQQATNCLAASCNQRGSPPPPVESYESFAKEIENRDRNAIKRLGALESNADFTRQR